MKNATKFYIKTQTCDGWCCAIVEMTEVEAAAVKKFLEVNNDFGEPVEWCGTCRISEGYDTYEEAVEAIRKTHGYLHFVN